MCITGDHDTPFISPCHFLLDRKKSHLFNSTNNLSSNNCKQQKPIHNSALFPNICSSAKFITTERSGILIILFILLGDILCTTARFTHLSEKFQTVAEDKNSELVFLNSPASSSVFKPARFTRRTSKPSGKVDTRKTDMKTYLNKARRHLSFDGQMEIKFLSSELVEFICHRLPDPCARAAYLRQHVRHDLCFRLPLLYLLPYTDSRLDKPYLSEYKPGTCKGSLSHLIYLPSDSIFEQFLTPVHICERSLLSLKKIMDDNLTSHFGIFDDLLEKSFCVKPFDSRPNVTGECQCQECQVLKDAEVIYHSNIGSGVNKSIASQELISFCSVNISCPRQEAYRSWFCATEFPLYYPLNDADLSIPLHSKSLGSDITDVEVHRIHVPVTISNLSTSSKMPRPRKSSYFLNRSSPPQPFNISVVESMSEPRNIYRKSSPTEFQVDSHLLFRLVIVQPCISWCTQVETVCPYLNPADPTSNGGEPAFLCDESHYHHSSRYQAVYWDVNTCESECCFGVSDSILLSVSIPDKKQYSTSTDIVLSYSSDVDKSSDNDSCSHLRDRCLHRFLSVHHSSLIAEFSSIVPDQTSSKYFNYDFNQSNRINSKNFSDYHSLSPALHKIDSISFRIILIISFTLHIFIWLHNIQVLLFQNFTSIIFLRYHHVTMTIMNTSLTSNDDNNTTDENTHYVSSSLSHSPTSLVSHPPLCLSDFTKHSNSCRPS